jgi:hypothetical protein
VPELPEKVVVQSKHSSLPNGWSNSSLETKYNESPDRMREVESQTVHVNYCVDLVSGSFDIVIHKLNVPFIKFCSQPITLLSMLPQLSALRNLQYQS